MSNPGFCNRSSHATPNHRSGFSLVFLSVILILVGGIALLGMPRVMQNAEQNHNPLPSADTRIGD